MNSTHLSDELHSWVTKTVGPFAVVASENHTHNLSDVWRLQAQSGETVYLKAATNRGKWEQECHAYEQWVPAAFGNFAPCLLATHESPNAVLLSALPGVCMDKVDLSPAQKRTAWFEAAHCLASLHGLATNAWFGNVRRNGEPAGETYTNACAFMQGRIENWITRGLQNQTLHRHEIAFARSVADDWFASLSGLPAVPAHRDFTPRNWICNPKNGAWTGAIDFEAACWGVWASDINRPWTREFLEQPDLAEAFWDGYQGRKPDENQQAQVKAVRLSHCLTSIVWAAEHNEWDFCQEARRGLAQLMRL